MNHGKNIRKFLFFNIVLLGLFLGCSQKSCAMGIPVSDPEEIAETIIEVSKSTINNMYQAKKLMAALQNLLTTGAEIWTMANAIYQQVQDLDNVQSYYQIVYGGIEDYLKDSQDVYKFYNDPCSALYPVSIHAINNAIESSNNKIYKHLGICMKKTFQKQQNASTVQTKLNTSETQLIAKQQQDLPSESARITTIQNQPETGALQALQVETQLLDKMIDEIRKLRAVTLAQNAAEAHQREQEAQDKARAAVYFHQVYETKGIIYMKSREWR